MAKPRGTPKTGGRKKGSTNKTTQLTRELFSEYVNGNFDEFKLKMKELDPDKYCRVYIDMCRYVMPSLQAVALDATIESQRTIEDLLIELSADNK